MNFILIALAVLAFATLAAFWACMATRYASNGEASPRIDEVFQFGLASGFISTPIMIAGLNDGDTVKAGIGLLLGILLGVSATVDRLTAWAPDGLMIPVTLLAFAYGPVGDSHGLAWGVGAGACAFVLAQALWHAQVKLDRRALPPPDIIALVIPFALFGIGYATLATLIIIACVLLIVLKNPDLEFLSGLKEAKEDARQDTGIKNGVSIAFLATAFPITLVVLGFSNLSFFSM